MCGFVRRIARLSVADDRWSAAWATLVAAAGVRGRAGLRYTAEVGPLVCRVAGGYELLLPAKLWNELDEPERTAILRHELAHLVRGDLWKSLAARVLALPHWFNPAAWWAVRRFDEAAEWACDRAAAADESPTSYAKALLRIGETAPARRSLWPRHSRPHAGRPRATFARRRAGRRYRDQENRAGRARRLPGGSAAGESGTRRQTTGRTDSKARRLTLQSIRCRRA